MTRDKKAAFKKLANKLFVSLEDDDTANAMLATSIILEGLIVLNKKTEGLKKLHLEFLSALQDILHTLNTGGIEAAKEFMRKTKTVVRRNNK